MKCIDSKRDRGDGNWHLSGKSPKRAHPLEENSVLGRALSMGTDSPGLQLSLPHLTDCVSVSKFLAIMSLFADWEMQRVTSIL